MLSKDGTDGSRDCRYFAAVYPIFKISLFFMYVVTLSDLFFAIGTVGLLLLAMLIVIVQPYKVKFATYNTTDSVLILLLAGWYASLLCLSVTSTRNLKFVKMSLIIIALISILPLLYIFVVTIHFLYIIIRINKRN